MAHIVEPDRQKYALVFDDGNHEEMFYGWPPLAAIEDCRRAAPWSWTQVELLVDGWDYMTVAEFPPLAPVNPAGEESK